MAKVGGRSAWIAWPVTVLCVAVVGALGVLAAPGVPGAIDFVGSTLRGASAAAAEAAAEDAGEDPATDCRSLYPDVLWSELTWTPEVLLSQNVSAPATTSSLTTALTPAVRFSCVWHTADGRSIATTVAAVNAAAPAVAQAALAAEGFACGVEGERVHCERDSDGILEIHDLQGELWVSSVLSGWVPEDYASLVAARAFA